MIRYAGILMWAENFPGYINEIIGLLISGSKVRALVRPPSKIRVAPFDARQAAPPRRNSILVGGGRGVRWRSTT